MRRVVRFAPALTIMGLIFFLSAQPDLGTGIEGWDTLLRKLGHMAVFGALFAAVLYALPGRPVAAAAITVLYAVSDEWHQTFTEGRHGSVVDVLIDAAGVAITWGAIRWYARRRRAARATRRTAARRATASRAPSR